MNWTFSKYQVLFRPVDKQDIEQLRVWRNRDDIRSNMLDQSIISEQQQVKWYESLSLRSDRYHFSLVFREQLIGYANVSLSGDSGETGLFIGHEKYRGSFLALCVGVALSDFCFNELKLEEIKATVLPHNSAAIRFNEQLGYKTEEKLPDRIIMTLFYEEFLNSRKGMEPLLSRFQKN